MTVDGRLLLTTLSPLRLDTTVCMIVKCAALCMQVTEVAMFTTVQKLWRAQLCYLICFKCTHFQRCLTDNSECRGGDVCNDLTACCSEEEVIKWVRWTWHASDCHSNQTKFSDWDRNSMEWRGRGEGGRGEECSGQLKALQQGLLRVLLQGLPKFDTYFLSLQY